MDLSVKSCHNLIHDTGNIIDVIIEAEMESDKCMDFGLLEAVY